MTSVDTECSINPWQETAMMLPTSYLSSAGYSTLGGGCESCQIHDSVTAEVTDRNLAIIDYTLG